MTNNITTTAIMKITEKITIEQMQRLIDNSSKNIPVSKNNQIIGKVTNLELKNNTIIGTLSIIDNFNNDGEDSLGILGSSP